MMEKRMGDCSGGNDCIGCNGGSSCSGDGGISSSQEVFFRWREERRKEHCKHSSPSSLARRRSEGFRVRRSRTMGNRRKGQNDSRVGEEEALHAAARAGDLVTVRSLCISNPLGVNSRDKHSRTPLHLAAWAGQTEVVNILCKHKADVSAAAVDDMGAIHFASQKGHVETVRILLTSGVSVKATNRKGFTALHYAVQGSHLELIAYLIRKGASLSARTKAGKTPLDLATSKEVRSHVIECEQTSKGEELTKSKEIDVSEQEQMAEIKNLSSHAKCESRDATEEEEKDDRVMRKVEEDEIRGSSGRPKKARISLDHLVAGNDVQEDDE